VEELQGLLDRGQEVLGRSDVVDRDLLGGRGGRCASHVVGCPCEWNLGPRSTGGRRKSTEAGWLWDCVVTRARGGLPRVTLQVIRCGPRRAHPIRGCRPARRRSHGPAARKLKP